MPEQQHTISREYSFEGKGLHTGVYVKVKLKPANVESGVVFYRTDIGGTPSVKACACNVKATDRGTVIQSGNAIVSTVEHLMAVFYAMGIDNIKVEIDGPEVPIMDGSAAFFSGLLSKDKLVAQGVERKYFVPEKAFHIEDCKSGSKISVYPAESTSFEVIVDFNSDVLGVQKATYGEDTDFHTQIAPCRTFVFVHDLIPLVERNLIRGGDIENAIVIAEKRVESQDLSKLKDLFGYSPFDVIEKGFVNSEGLKFENECARHKLMDLIGDLALSGVYLKARVVAEKPGHTINTEVAKKILTCLK